MHALERPYLAPSSSRLSENARLTHPQKPQSSKTPFTTHSSANSHAGNSSVYSNNKKLGFFGPTDPTTVPLHMKLCIGGVLVFPLWWIGAVVRCDEADCWSALWQFRCRVFTIISVLIVAAIIVIHGLSMLD
ncbi:hypothetical protein FRC08_017595 [Ceratobasidium sp. 394]|nr:hypothetical protein FRC08_017595 [Ceratobasidium sp. 394]